ncbi:MAG: hypothetical protein N2381_05715, partial [Armatimonadetes bacterium]|nr:hypothetical protein [Armatimonadota bacterium]
MREAIRQPWILRWKPNDIFRLRLLVDEAQDKGQPIRREHDLPKFRADGKEFTDGRAMRQGIIKTTEQHIADLNARYPDEEPIAFVGNGNLLANFGFVAWFMGVLYHLADEPVFKQLYTCIVNWKDGCVTVEDIWFARENGRVIVLRKTDSILQD